MGRLCRYQKLKNDEEQHTQTKINTTQLKNTKNTTNKKDNNGTIAQEVCLHFIIFFIAVRNWLFFIRLFICFFFFVPDKCVYFFQLIEVRIL